MRRTVAIVSGLLVDTFAADCVSLPLVLTTQEERQEQEKAFHPLPPRGIPPPS